MSLQATDVTCLADVDNDAVFAVYRPQSGSSDVVFDSGIGQST